MVVPGRGGPIVKAPKRTTMTCYNSSIFRASKSSTNSQDTRPPGKLGLCWWEGRSPLMSKESWNVKERNPSASALLKVTVAQFTWTSHFSFQEEVLNSLLFKCMSLRPSSRAGGGFCSIRLLGFCSSIKHKDGLRPAHQEPRCKCAFCVLGMWLLSVSGAVTPGFCPSPPLPTLWNGKSLNDHYRVF